ncbi:MAG: DinB family protein [Bacteroidetes bacterium]|nr:DinB family protein [Bacteroidota bacterium]
MPKEIEFFRKIRKHVLQLLEHMHAAQLNQVPTGFSNNLVWNLGHLLVTQQSILYRSSGLQPKLDDSYSLLFKSGTRPEKEFAAEDINAIKQLFKAQITDLEADWAKGIFQHYNSWNHRDTGIVVSSMADALNFIIFHESMHLGIIKSIKKQVTTSPK